MFAGHAALALLVKAGRPRPPLVLLGVAAFGPDLLEWAFATFGWHNRTFSHSLPAVGLGAIVAGLLYYRFGKRSSIDAAAIAALWLSHWFTDFITGVKPTWPGGPDVGLNLYTLPMVDLAMESLLVVMGWLVYRHSLTPRRRGRALLLPLGLIAAQVVFAMALSGRNPLPGVFGSLHLSP
jgi:hypothetical protein